MKVLLTGRKGQIGSHLARLLPGFCDFWAVDQDDFDLSDTRDIFAALDGFKPNLIINAAAYTNVDSAEKNRDLAFAMNANAPKVMAEWAADNAATLVHYSTDYVYDGSGDEPWVETDLTEPINVYGESKLAGDIAVSESGASHLILRTSWIYAASGVNFLRSMLALGAQRDTLKVVDDQIGAPTSASLVASVTVDILNQTKFGGIETFKTKGGVLHCASSGETSWHGFAAAIFEEAAKRGCSLKIKNLIPISSSEYPVPAARPANSRLSLDKLSSDFQTETPHWRDTLCHVLDELFA